MLSWSLGIRTNRIGTEMSFTRGRGKKEQIAKLVDYSESSDSEEALMEKHRRRKTKAVAQNVGVKQVSRLVRNSDSSNSDEPVMKKYQKTKRVLRCVFAGKVGGQDPSTQKNPEKIVGQDPEMELAARIGTQLEEDIETTEYNHEAAEFVDLSSPQATVENPDCKELEDEGVANNKAMGETQAFNDSIHFYGRPFQYVDPRELLIWNPSRV